MHSGEIQFDLAGFFQPYVQQWLVNTDNKTTQWVQAVSVQLVLHVRRTHDDCNRPSPQTKCGHFMCPRSMTNLAITVPTRRYGGT